jgi:4-amino-4-deoxy-L-arabinose transferase-like glycosyltransferase
MEIESKQQSLGKLTKKDVPFLAGLFFMGLFLFLFYIWAMPLIDPDEPRYASTARDMIINGNWIVPHFNGEPRINKPPLFYWTIALCYKIFGVNEFSSRLPSALAAFGTAIITYLWGRRSGSCKDGFWSAMVLMSSPLFFLIARFCITDMLLTFFICASLYLFYIEYTETEKRNNRRLFLYFLLSMVFLVKGPVGILLFIIITICFLLCVCDFKYIKRLWYLPGFLTFIGIICAWGIPFWLTLGTKQIFSLLSQETSGRFFSGYAHPETFYYYLPVFVIGFFPWSLFMFVVIFHFFRKKKTFSGETKKQIYFFCAWCIITIIFFSCSRSKLMTYILPMSPSVALLMPLISKWEMEDKFGKMINCLLWFILSVSILVPITLIITMPKWLPMDYSISIHHVFIPIIILLIGSIIVMFTFSVTRRFRLTQKVICFTNCVFLIITIVYSSKYIGTFRSTRDIVQSCHLDQKTNYMLFSNNVPPSLVFYSGKNAMDTGTSTQFRKLVADKKEPIYVVLSLKDYAKRKDWFQKINFHPVCQNNVHIILGKAYN